MNYLELVNTICARTNEVQLSESTFGTTAGNAGFYADAKEAVNAAIRDINQMAYEWPFNHVTYNESLVAGSARYSFQSNTKTVDMNTFRIQENTSFNTPTQLLKEITYENYLQSSIQDEYDASTAIRDIPRYVARTPDSQFVVSPIPDNAYTLTYEYYTLPTDLSDYTDEPSIPDQFKYVVNLGAMYYAEMFRENPQKATIYEQKFQDAVAQMRSIYINRYDPAIRSTMISKGGYNTGNYIETAN